MELKEALVEASVSLLPTFGIHTDYQGESEEASLTSANQVNLLIGLTTGMKGNIVFGMNKSAILKIVSGMMGGMKLEGLDAMAQSAAGELANMIVGSALGKLEMDVIVDYAPPTIAIGERMFVMISRLKSRKLVFQMDGELMNIIFCIEN